jgi:hypothetical protein
VTTGKEVAPLTPQSYAVAVMDFLQHGDITKLPIDAQLRLYEEKSQEIGMSAMDRPFSIINLKGKMTLYLTAFAANRYASDKNIVRTIVGKPTIETLDGKKAIYVHIRGTLNGRTEEDHYWREISPSDSIMVQMSKAQSAARRRVTMLFMSPRALQGVISEDDIYQLGLDEKTTDSQAIDRIVDAQRATVTEETPQETHQTPAKTLAQLQAQVQELCEQFGINPKVMNHWARQAGLRVTVAGMSQLVEWLQDAPSRARGYVYTWALKDALLEPATVDALFAEHIQHKVTGVTSWLEWWDTIKRTPDEWAVRLTDLANDTPQPAA